MGLLPSMPGRVVLALCLYSLLTHCLPVDKRSNGPGVDVSVGVGAAAEEESAPPSFEDVLIEAGTRSKQQALSASETEMKAMYNQMAVAAHEAGKSTDKSGGTNWLIQFPYILYALIGLGVAVVVGLCYVCRKRVKKCIELSEVGCYYLVRAIVFPFKVLWWMLEAVWYPVKECILWTHTEVHQCCNPATKH